MLGARACVLSAVVMFLCWSQHGVVTAARKSKKRRYGTPAKAEELRKKGEQLQQAGRMKEASAMYLKALKTNPRIDDTVQRHAFFNNLGWTLHGFDEKRAKKYYQKAIRLLPNPPFPHAFLNLGDIHRKRRDFQPAIRAYSKALEIKPKPSVYASLGQVAMWAGDFDASIDALKAGLKIEPDYSEMHNYLGQVFSLQQKWGKASKAFVNTVRHGLPKDATGCYRDHWRLVEGWESVKGVTVTKLPAPIGSRGKFTVKLSDTVFQDRKRDYKLVRIRRARLEGAQLTRLFQDAPRCTYFIGEHTASGVPPWNFGIIDENQPPLDPPRDIQEYFEPVVSFFDQRAGHSNFYHHQAETVSRVLWFFRDVYSPRDAKWKNAKFLMPAASLIVLDNINAASVGVNLPPPNRIIRWNQNDRYAFKELYLLDWSSPIRPAKVGKLGNQDWKKFTEPLWQLHLPPRSLLHLHRDALRNSKAAEEVADRNARNPIAPRIVYYSRRDMEKRHIEGEEDIIAALEDQYGPDSVSVFIGGITIDLPKALSFFYDADVIIGPHGAGLANMIMAPEDAAVILIPMCDDVGCPSSQDIYFGYLAGALGLKFATTEGSEENLATFFTNYTASGDLIDQVIELTERALANSEL